MKGFERSNGWILRYLKTYLLPLCKRAICFTEYPVLGEDAADLSADLAVAENYLRITAALQWHIKDASLKLRLTHVALQMFM